MKWLRDHFLLVIIALIAVVAYVIAKLRRAPVPGSFKEIVNDLKMEKRIIDAKADVAKEAARVGKEEAVKRILLEHEEQIQRLDEEKRSRIEALSKEPEDLVTYILHVTR